ncbi:MAG TPA: hypothetical protein PK048_01400 [Candidatus Absconditabacterales bacterium]|nr:hypothetical protein [Candidatus Absconditabacterales bacterium]
MKYNRPQLKIQYLQGDYLTVFDFYKEHLKGTQKAPTTDVKGLPGNWKRATKGWAEEKQIMQQKLESMIDDAKRGIADEIKKQTEAQLGIDIAELIKSKKALFILINKKIVHLAKHSPQDILAREIDILLGIIKRELGEPTTLTKNHNITEQVFIPSEDELDDD